MNEQAMVVVEVVRKSRMQASGVTCMGAGHEAARAGDDSPVGLGILVGLT